MGLGDPTAPLSCEAHQLLLYPPQVSGMFCPRRVVPRITPRVLGFTHTSGWGDLSGWLSLGSSPLPACALSRDSGLQEQAVQQQPGCGAAGQDARLQPLPGEARPASLGPLVWDICLQNPTSLWSCLWAPSRPHGHVWEPAARGVEPVLGWVLVALGSPSPADACA